jgi:hypothetical protein
MSRDDEKLGRKERKRYPWIPGNLGRRQCHVARADGQRLNILHPYPIDNAHLATMLPIQSNAQLHSSFPINHLPAHLIIPIRYSRETQEGQRSLFHLQEK